MGRPALNRALPWLAATLALGALFLAGQWAAWKQLAAQGFAFDRNATPASYFFYLITGFHAAHLLAGVLALVLCLSALGWLKRVELRLLDDRVLISAGSFQALAGFLQAWRAERRGAAPPRHAVKPGRPAKARRGGPARRGWPPHGRAGPAGRQHPQRRQRVVGQQPRPDQVPHGRDEVAVVHRVAVEHRRGPVAEHTEEQAAAARQRGQHRPVQRRHRQLARLGQQQRRRLAGDSTTQPSPVPTEPAPAQTTSPAEVSSSSSAGEIGRAHV